MNGSRRKKLRDDITVALEKPPSRGQMRKLKKLYNRRGTATGGTYIKPSKSKLEFPDGFFAFARRK